MGVVKVGFLSNYLVLTVQIQSGCVRPLAQSPARQRAPEVCMEALRGHQWGQGCIHRSMKPDERIQSMLP